MYERFTNRAQKVMQLANQEAQRFNHEYIGTEHILLGLVKEGSGSAVNVLKNLDINPRKIIVEVAKLVQSGPDRVTMGKLPQTPRAKKVIEYAIEEARHLNHNYVGTEHLFLGLLREPDGVAGQVLRNLGLRLEDARKEVRRLLGQEVPTPKPEPQAAQVGKESISSCPAPVRLLRLLHAALPENEQAPLMEHLETCAGCREALEALAAGQDSWDGVARNLRADNGPGRTRPYSAGREGTLDFLDPPAKPGQLGKLAHYEILDVIGRGGMGVVLKALDTTLQRVVAVKVMAPELAVSGTARERFRREAHAAAAVGHDNIVTIHAVDEAKGLPYLVMQYVSGVSLQEKLDREGLLELKEILRIGIQTADGLAAAHAQGLIHRDIKPANILLENGIQRVKITDFGLARAVDDASLTKSGVIAGTPQYMSPEQALGEPQDHRTDLFSLGSVLYTLCTGRPPFRAPNTLAVLRRVAEEPPRRIRQVNPEIPDWLEAIVETMMEKHPVDRFQSAAEVARLLESHLAHLQKPAHIPQPPPVPPAKPRKKPAKRPRTLFWLLMVTGVLSLACCVLPAGLLWSYRVAYVSPPQSAVWVSPILPNPTPKVTLPLGKEGLKCLAFAPDGTLAVGFEDGSIHVVRNLSQEGVTTLKAFPPVTALAFAPDGATLFSGGGGDRAPNVASNEVIRWNLAKEKESQTFEWPPGLLRTLALSPDGKWLAAGGRNGVLVWDAATGKKYPPPEGLGHVLCLAFSADGTTAAAAGEDMNIRLWDVESGISKGQLRGHTGAVSALCFQSNGERLGSASLDDKLLLWDLRNQQLYGVTSAPERSWVRSFACSRDGRVLVMGLANQQAMIQVDPFSNWHLKPMPLSDNGREPGGIVAITPDGKLVATGHRNGTIRVWDLGGRGPALPGGPPKRDDEEIIIPDRKEEAARKDREKLQGTWERVAFLRGDTRLAEDPDDTITFEGDQFDQKFLGELRQANRFEIIDATTEPRQIDFFSTELKFKGLRYRGIYKIE
jgi:uncharacterized protein (TIGR03067 family)